MSQRNLDFTLGVGVLGGYCFATSNVFNSFLTTSASFSRPAFSKAFNTNSKLSLVFEADIFEDKPI
jgi:hypothetical protein